MVAATRGGNLSIPVQLWLKGNFPQIRKGGIGGVFFTSLHREERKLGKGDIQREEQGRGEHKEGNEGGRRGH